MYNHRCPRDRTDGRQFVHVHRHSSRLCDWIQVASWVLIRKMKIFEIPNDSNPANDQCIKNSNFMMTRTFWKSSYLAKNSNNYLFIVWRRSKKLKIFFSTKVHRGARWAARLLDRVHQIRQRSCLLETAIWTVHQAGQIRISGGWSEEFSLNQEENRMAINGQKWSHIDHRHQLWP